jgi:hypothetical protein
MAQMQAKRAFRYANKRLAVGDRFETKSDRDATLLEAARQAIRVTKLEEKAKRKRGKAEQLTATPVPAPVASPVPAPVAPTAMPLPAAPQTTPPPVVVPSSETDLRSYTRRDMEAED